MDKFLQNKTALVTGAVFGIGKSTAILYGQLGAKVMLSDIDKDLGQQVADEMVADGAVAHFFQADVSDPVQCQKLIQETVSAFGSLDMAFNNAGIGGRNDYTADYSVQGWQHIIAVNLNSVFYCLKYELLQAYLYVYL